MNNQHTRNKIIGSIIVLLLAVLPVFSQGERYTNKSVLAEGNWYKIKIPETGVYKLTYNELRSMGLSNPANVKLYGYGGWMLDEVFTNPYIDDLPPVSIWMSTTPDKFGEDENDYILFYGKGDMKWAFDEKRKEFVHTQHPYSHDSFYFVTESNDAPNLMTDAPAVQNPNVTIDSFVDYYLHEKDLLTLCESGRDLFGENFMTENAQDFGMALPGITTDSITLNVNFVARTKGCLLEVATNGVQQNVFDVPVVGTGTTDNYAKAKVLDALLTVKNMTDNSMLGLTYHNYQGDQNVYLNFFRLTYTRKLKPYGAVTLFRDTIKNSSIEFKIAESTDNLIVFDVTNSQIPTKVSTSLVGDVLTFGASNNTIKEYALVDRAANIPSPVFIGKVTNQNLHGLETKEMVIIVQPVLQKYAEMLKAAHEAEGLSCQIANPEAIYNEFSSGKPDATAYRRFMKMFYDRGTNESDRPKYLLLFGDGTYDNRFLIESNSWSDHDKKSMLLTYQSENSINETASYTTDDYFGFLDDKEGVTLNKDSVDLGIGRIPVRTEQDAQTIVNKIINYMADKDKSIWKNNLCFVADDAVASGNSITSEKQHIDASEKFAKSITRNYPSFIVNRIYCDMYERVTTPSGIRYPDVKKAITDRLNSGVLILNYMGHGSSRDWTHEYIFTSSDAEQLTNTQLPLFITASCDYGRYDGNIKSGSEALLNNSKGGAIALITATRVVFSEKNKELNSKILDHIFEKKDGRPSRLGDIIRHSKQALTTDSNKLRFLLLGDPAMRLSYPDETYNVKVKQVTVDNVPVNGGNAQFKALSSVKLEGEIVDKNNLIIDDFNGILESVIFDSEQDLQTRGNTSTGTGDATAIHDYTDFTNVIYTGKVGIDDGKFVIDFTVPKDILYSNNAGKISFYAYDTDNTQQAQGYFNEYIVGGTNPDVVEESNSPVISKIYLNRSDFKSGDMVNATPLFYAEVSDDSGINLSSAIGHNISLVIDGSSVNNLTPYFESMGGSNKNGIIKFQMPVLSEGDHTLQFKIWDVWNNSATTDLDFEVVRSYESAMYNFVVDGNPAQSGTTFKFSTNLTTPRIKVKYSVYSLSGDLLWDTEIDGSADASETFTRDWDLQANNGVKLTQGMYICKATVSVDGNIKASKSEKLIVLGQ